MSIPDTNLLKFNITLECGHVRRTMHPCKVGGELPCIKENLELKKITKILNTQNGQEVNEIWWESSQAAMLAAYDTAGKREKRLWGKVIKGYILGH